MLVHADSVEVVEVIDGDTMRVRLDGKNELVRLLGIDTPEASANLRAEKPADWHSIDADSVRKLGERVKTAVSAMIPQGATVRLEYDRERRDQYGRVLAWVFLQDGTLLNETLLRLGYAHYSTKSPHFKYAARMAQAAQDGKVAQRGLWATAVEKSKSREERQQGNRQRSESLFNF
jgi:micrococcal nuclease